MPDLLLMLLGALLAGLAGIAGAVLLRPGTSSAHSQRARSLPLVGRLLPRDVPHDLPFEPSPSLIRRRLGLPPEEEPASDEGPATEAERTRQQAPVAAVSAATAVSPAAPVAGLPEPASTAPLVLVPEPVSAAPLVVAPEPVSARAPAAPVASLPEPASTASLPVPPTPASETGGGIRLVVATASRRIRSLRRSLVGRRRDGALPAPPAITVEATGPTPATGTVEVSPRPMARRILEGDHTQLDRLVATLSAGDPDGAASWQHLLEEFFEAILERALEAGAVELPSAHPFWGTFSRDQGRQILAALASLGHRFDGLGGWQDDRVPTKRDLSIAIGYAGLDPVRIRAWPSPAEMATLLSQAQIAGADYLAGVAPGLSEIELEPVLRGRTDALEKLFSDWVRVRALLLAES